MLLGTDSESRSRATWAAFRESQEAIRHVQKTLLQPNPGVSNVVGECPAPWVLHGVHFSGIEAQTGKERIANRIPAEHERELRKIVCGHAGTQDGSEIEVGQELCVFLGGDIDDGGCIGNRINLSFLVDERVQGVSPDRFIRDPTYIQGGFSLGLPVVGRHDCRGHEDTRFWGTGNHCASRQSGSLTALSGIRHSSGYLQARNSQ